MENRKVSISTGNKKMGAIPSVSLPPVVTCHNCETCAKKCYAVKLMRIYKSVKKAYYNNLDILNNDRNAYFLQVKASAMTTRFFRFHVSGDIVDIDYLDRMVKLARDCKKTEFLAFTKNYDDVNNYFTNHRKPKNLHLFPTASVILKGQTPNPSHKICGGNCSACACQGVGCWELKKGETIAFYEH